MSDPGDDESSSNTSGGMFAHWKAHHHFAGIKETALAPEAASPTPKRKNNRWGLRNRIPGLGSADRQHHPPPPPLPPSEDEGELPEPRLSPIPSYEAANGGGGGGGGAAKLRGLFFSRISSSHHHNHKEEAVDYSSVADMDTSTAAGRSDAPSFAQSHALSSTREGSSSGGGGDGGGHRSTGTGRIPILRRLKNPLKRLNRSNHSHHDGSIEAASEYDGKLSLDSDDIGPEASSLCTPRGGGILRRRNNRAKDAIPKQIDLTDSGEHSPATRAPPRRKPRFKDDVEELPPSMLAAALQNVSIPMPSTDHTTSSVSQHTTTTSPPNRSRSRSDDSMVSFDPLSSGSNNGRAPPPPPRSLAHTKSTRHIGSVGERARYSVYVNKNRNTKRKYRVRPHHCFDEPVHMTEEEIYTDSLQPSSHFEPMQSYLKPSFKPTTNPVFIKPVSQEVQEIFGSPEQDGRIGSLRVEVLGCVALARNRPDITVYMVSGDAAFCTDTINGYRSPMWPSASKRAALFPIHHAYARLYVGVFDVRERRSKENDVFCGRICLDLSVIRPDTEYDVTFPLRASTFVYDRRKRGVIRLRFSLHWFQERQAMMSYFCRPVSRSPSSPLVDGQPTIPCADPKTFRNVAVTLYGADLPGKYSRSAFRATTREFILYQQNLQMLIKVWAMDAIFYEKPWVSLYLLGASMYCAWYSEVRLVPPVIVGYFLLLYLESYWFYIEREDHHLGYKPLSILEFVRGLLIDPRINPPAFQPIWVQKRTKQRGGQPTSPVAKTHRRGTDDGVDDPTNGNHHNHKNDAEIERVDHREFPFSERDAYPKFGVEDALAPGSNNRRGSTTRLHGRLSVYYTTTNRTEGDRGQSGDEIESSEDSDRDDETIVTEADTMYNIDMDYDEDLEAIIREQERQLEPQSDNRRLRVGPPQENDKTVKGGPPPHIHLKRVEAMMHRFSLRVSVEQVHAPRTLTDTGATSSTDSGGGIRDPAQALDIIRRRKIQYDEFDKLLGLQTRSANPINRIASMYMGPLMRMLRIAIYIGRIVFHVSAWRDPFLSFWLLLCMVLLLLILIAFPWRPFFLLVSFLCFGPQNIFVRHILQRQTEKKAVEETETDEHPGLETSGSGHSNTDPLSSSGSVHSDGGRRGAGGLFHRIRRPQTVRHTSSGEERPFFATDGRQTQTGKKGEPRCVTVPYSTFKKDRFFDWPPDPTVSRATPMLSQEFTEEFFDEDSITSVDPLEQEDFSENSTPHQPQRVMSVTDTAAIELYGYE